MFPQVPGETETQLITGHWGVILLGLQVMSQLPVRIPGFEVQVYLQNKTLDVHNSHNNQIALQQLYWQVSLPFAGRIQEQREWADGALIVIDTVVVAAAAVKVVSVLRTRISWKDHSFCAFVL